MNDFGDVTVEHGVYPVFGAMSHRVETSIPVPGQRFVNALQLLQHSFHHHIFYAVSKWPAAGQSLQITKWPAIDLFPLNLEMYEFFLSIETPLFIKRLLPMPVNIADLTREIKRHHIEILQTESWLIKEF